MLQRREASLLRNRRRRFASAAAENESELTSENDYEDIELGRAGTSGWQPPSKPPRRKRSKSTSDFETGSPVEITQRKSRRDVGTEMGRATTSKGVIEGSSTVNIIDVTDPNSAGWSVSDRIERIQMCPLRVDQEEDVSKSVQKDFVLFVFFVFYNRKGFFK